LTPGFISAACGPQGSLQPTTVSSPCTQSATTRPEPKVQVTAETCNGWWPKKLGPSHLWAWPPSWGSEHCPLQESHSLLLEVFVLILNIQSVIPTTYLLKPGENSQSQPHAQHPPRAPAQPQHVGDTSKPHQIGTIRLGSLMLCCREGVAQSHGFSECFLAQCFSASLCPAAEDTSDTGTTSTHPRASCHHYSTLSKEVALQIPTHSPRTWLDIFEPTLDGVPQKGLLIGKINSHWWESNPIPYGPQKESPSSSSTSPTCSLFQSKTLLPDPITCLLTLPN
jgi:hypothetical protein